jgi:hypothetical protein
VKRDAFDDLPCPFSYTAELRKAREALNLKVGTYISENSTVGYRELAKMFGVSAAALCAIAKKYSRKRKPGRRSGRTNVTFDVRHTIAGREFTTRVTVIREDKRNIDQHSMRSLLEMFFRTTDVVKGGKLKPDRHTQYTTQELHDLVYSASALKERQHLP